MNFKKTHKVFIFIFNILFLLTTTTIAYAEPTKEQPLINWRGWDDTIFQEAKSSNKLVILDLEAVWCHWCHVMDQKTYSNKEVADYLNKHFIPIKVDQDSRPDLSQRYEDYGWPAIIIFNSAGKELAKKSGYQEVGEFLPLLKKSVEHPNDVEEDESKPKSFSEKGELSAELTSELKDRHHKKADRELGGLNSSHKYIDQESVELYIKNGLNGDAEEKKMASLTLSSNLKLIDPIWGGAYQYSTDSDWDHPHFEKIVSTQSANLRLYALGYTVFKDEQYLKAAQSIHSYLNNFLKSPEGAFYTSQDADLIKGEHSGEYFLLDDAKRRAQGIPVVDKNIYARENGLLIEALATLYSYSADQTALEDAVKAANWITANRSLGGGGFKHGDNDLTGPFLGDTLNMTTAYVALYLTTTDKKWLLLAQDSARFIAKNFAQAKDQQNIPGFITSVFKEGGAFTSAVRQIDENVNVARTFNLLWHYTGNKEFKDMADQAMKFLATKEIALQRSTTPGILLANAEITSAPFHITVVGGKENETTKSLFSTALKIPSTYRRLELWDKKEGQLINPDVTYPNIPKPAAFLCANKRCSLPIFRGEDLVATVEKFGK